MQNPSSLLPHRRWEKKAFGSLECSKSSSSEPEMKGMKFATGGDEAKVAAFGGALAESVLDDASAEERDDSGGDESDDGKHN